MRIIVKLTLHRVHRALSLLRLNPKLHLKMLQMLKVLKMLQMLKMLKMLQVTWRAWSQFLLR